MVQFLPLDVTDEDSVGVVLSHLDNAIQYGEHEEPKEPADVSSGRGRRPLLLASEGSVRSRLPVRARGCKVLSVDSLVPRRWIMATLTRANEQSSLADRQQNAGPLARHNLRPPRCPTCPSLSFSTFLSLLLVVTTPPDCYIL